MNQEKTVLIIEDDVDMIEAVKLILSPKNLKVIEALTPEDGYEKAKKLKPDLIILDVMFGSKGESKGFDYATRFKSEKTLAAIPILMMTSVNSSASDFKFSPETDGEYLPVDDFVEKPAQPEELIKRVEKLLQQKTSMWVNWPEKKG